MSTHHLLVSVGSNKKLAVNLRMGPLCVISLSLFLLLRFSVLFSPLVTVCLNVVLSLSFLDSLELREYVY